LVLISLALLNPSPPKFANVAYGYSTASQMTCDPYLIFDAVMQRTHVLTSQANSGNWDSRALVSVNHTYLEMRHDILGLRSWCEDSYCVKFIRVAACTWNPSRLDHMQKRQKNTVCIRNPTF
jgi:hypothetical protein